MVIKKGGVVIAAMMVFFTNSRIGSAHAKGQVTPITAPNDPIPTDTRSVFTTALMMVGRFR